jgi:hypothetical protein
MSIFCVGISVFCLFFTHPEHSLGEGQRKVQLLLADVGRPAEEVVPSQDCLTAQIQVLVITIVLESMLDAFRYVVSVICKVNNLLVQC